MNYNWAYDWLHNDDKNEACFGCFEYQREVSLLNINYNLSTSSAAVATLYLVDTAEIVRLRPGDELQGMLVDEITESTVRFSRDERTLVISRDAG